MPSINGQILGNVYELIKTAIALSVLGALLKFTGTKFFGVDLAGLLFLLIFAILLLAAWQSDLRTVRWIKKRLLR